MLLQNLKGGEMMTKMPDMIMSFKIEKNKDWNGENPFGELECTLTIQTHKKISVNKFVEMDSSFRIGLELYSILVDRFREFGFPVNHDFLADVSVDASRDIELDDVLTFALDVENIPTKGHYYEW